MNDLDLVQEWQAHPMTAHFLKGLTADNAARLVELVSVARGTTDPNVARASARYEAGIRFAKTILDAGKEEENEQQTQQDDPDSD